jgi:thymidine kinase
MKNNKYGTVETIMGPMYAGKTSELLKRILWLNHQNLDILVVKPKIDNRYSDNEIVTHTNQSFSCVSANNLSDILNNDSIYKNHTIFIDEIQFFKLDDVISVFDSILKHGVNIIAAGLDQDSSGIPFESSAYVLALSDIVTKINSFCSVCGQSASKTYKINNTGNRVDVASHGVYEARCLEHWTPVK